MKRYSSIVLLVFLQLAVFAAPTNPAQVTISLTTKVDEYLMHGFLPLTGGSTIASNATVENAFASTGAVFVYAIKTNAAIPFTVTAEVAPFRLMVNGSPTSTKIDIDNVLVKKGIPSDSGDATEAVLLDISMGSYKLMDFVPDFSGMHTYPYTLTVFVNQDELQEAPWGEYQSTVSIGITPTS